MKAVFSANPYKFWNRGCKGTLHLFDDDKAAEAYFTILWNEYVNYPYAREDDGKHIPMIIDTPNEVEVAECWARLVCDFASIIGYDRIEFHRSEETKYFFDLLEADLNVCERFHTATNWTWPSDNPFLDGIVVSNIGVDTDSDFWKWKKESPHELEEKLCDLLHDVFDIEPFEWYDPDTNERNGELVYTEEIVPSAA